MEKRGRLSRTKSRGHVDAQKLRLENFLKLLSCTTFHAVSGYIFGPP